MLKLSIVIPVYNVEQYVGRCLESCLDQDLPKDEYEIIVVNDGTKDNSVQVIEKYITPENNVTLVHRENGGLSAARNTGLKHAQGEYVWFVDSDDTITPGSLKAIVEGCTNNIDMLGIQYRLVYDDVSKNKTICSAIVNGIKDGRYVTKYGHLAIPVQFCIYRHEFLIKNNLLFAEGKVHEDSEFKPRAIYLAGRIATIDYVCYNYYKGNSDSITANYSYRNVDGYMFAAESINRFCANVKKGYRKYLYREVGRCVNGAIYSYANIRNIKEKETSKERIRCSKDAFKSMMKSRSFMYMTEGVFLLVAPSVFLFMYPKLKKM